MKAKIIATFMALGMVMMGFAMIPALAQEPATEPSTVPTILPIGGVYAPVVTDNQNVAFAVAGWCDVAVDVSLEVGTSADFAIGSGDVGIFTAADGTGDNLATGAYKVSASGLIGSTTYNWRLTLTNGADTIYYPDASTTETATTTNIGTVKSNMDPLLGIEDEVSSTPQDTGFLMITYLDVDGTLSLPLSTIVVGTNYGTVVGNNFRSSVAPYDYIQDSVTTSYYNFVGGMWNDGGGMDPWLNDFTDDVLAYPGMNFNYQTHELVMAADPTATATGPTGTSNDATPDVTYTTTDSPASVDIYYTNNGGTSWTLYGTDADATSPYTGAALPEGTYSWNAVPTGGNPTDVIPTGAGDIEAGTYIIDLTAPTVTPTPLDGATGVSAAAGTYVLAFNEPMAAVGSVTTDLPGASGSWNGNNYEITYTALNTATTYNVAQNVAFTDVAGNPLAAAFAFDFTTAAETNPPQTTTTNLPATYTGILPNDFVLTASGTDAEANVVSCEYRVDGGAWTAMTMVGAPGLTSNFQATIDLHGFTLAAHTIETRATDANSNVDATPDSDALTVTDTADPLHSYAAGTPADGATRSTGQLVDIFVTYEDFTDAASANYYYNDGAWNGPFAMTVDGTWIGSFGIDYSFQVTSAVDGAIQYYYEMTDGNGNTVTGATQTVNFLTGAAVADPYPIFGYTTYYDGTQAGGFTNPIGDVLGALDPNSAVAITWWNADTLAWETINTVSDANAQFSVDIYNYTDGGVVFVNGTSNAYGNNGYNYTYVDILGMPGGARQDVMFGVPYDVIYNPAGPFATIAGNALAVTYEIVDIDGVLAQGYFTHADGAFDFFSGDALFVDDAAHPLIWNGLTGGLGGTYTASVIFVTGGVQYLNISEGGAAEANPYLTPWGAFDVDPAGTVPGYLNDWENTTVVVTSGAFIWNLVVGWNLVCVPMNPDNDGVDPGTGAYFGAYDALREIFDDTGDTLTTIADRTGGNPSTYNTFDYGTAENLAADFALDYVHGYWVYASIAGTVDVQAQNVSNLGVDNVVDLTVGWNLLGFTHNGQNGGAAPGGWNLQPTASDYTDGTIDAGLDIAGAQTQIIATWFVQATQHYNSYVTTDNFAGMATHDWIYNTNYAYGYWVWSSAAVAGVTFNVAY